MSPIYPHSLRDRFLAKAGRKPNPPQIEAKKLANIHPNDGHQSRIILPRILIRDKVRVPQLLGNIALHKF